MAAYYLGIMLTLEIIDPADYNRRKPEDRILYHPPSRKSIAGKHGIATEAWT